MVGTMHKPNRPTCTCVLRLGFLLRAAPWYVYNALLQSPRRVDDPNQADVIYVYDYCRFMCGAPKALVYGQLNAFAHEPLPAWRLGWSWL